MKTNNEYFDSASIAIGSVIKIDKNGSFFEKTAAHEFNKYLFEYFEELSTGYTGWGVAFTMWLELRKGWKIVGYKSMEKIW
jgi:hypothetical protein